MNHPPAFFKRLRRRVRSACTGGVPLALSLLVGAVACDDDETGGVAGRGGSGGAGGGAMPGGGAGTGGAPGGGGASGQGVGGGGNGGTAGQGAGGGGNGGTAGQGTGGGDGGAGGGAAGGGDGGAGGGAAGGGNGGAAGQGAGGTAGQGAGGAGGGEPGPACGPTASFPTETFPVDTTGGTAQVHPAAAASEGGVWVTYVKAAPGASNFSVFATRFGCDGSALVAPFAVNTDAGGSAGDPSIAISGGRVMVAWLFDSGQAPTNLSIRYRIFELDGAAVTPADLTLRLRKGGVEVASNAWLPQLAPLPGGGFALAGTWGDPGAPGFQAFATRLSAEGAADEIITLNLQPGEDHNSPQLATLADGTILASWTEAAFGAPEGDRVFRARIDPGASAPAPGSVGQVTPARGSTSGYAASGARAYVAMSTDGESETDVVVRDGLDFSSNARQFAVGEPTRRDYNPWVAASPGGGAVIFQRITSGANADLFAQGFTDAGDALVPGPLTPIPLVGKALIVYKPALVHVGGDTYLAAWSEGPVATLAVNARFVRLPGGR